MSLTFVPLRMETGVKLAPPSNTVGFVGTAVALTDLFSMVLCSMHPHILHMRRQPRPPTLVFAQGTRSLTQWSLMATKPATIQRDCPLEARSPGARIQAEHNMTYETCLRAHGRPLDAEFRSECEPALAYVIRKRSRTGIPARAGLRGRLSG
jgi:hypothetical protein